MEPERQLWIAVLVHAVRDLCLGGEKSNAVKRWMLTRNQDTDFRLVCDLAGYDADAFRSAVVRDIKRRTGQFTDAPSLDDALLGGQPVNAKTFGLPEHVVRQRIDELREEGYTVWRISSDVYRCMVERKPSPPVNRQQRRRKRTQGRAQADKIILSGKPFHAGPAGSYLRARIGTLRQKGFSIKPLGRNGKFICAKVSQIISREAKTSQNSSYVVTVPQTVRYRQCK